MPLLFNFFLVDHSAVTELAHLQVSLSGITRVSPQAVLLFGKDWTFDTVSSTGMHAFFHAFDFSSSFEFNPLDTHALWICTHLTTTCSNITWWPIFGCQQQAWCTSQAVPRGASSNFCALRVISMGLSQKHVVVISDRLWRTK